MKEAAAAAAETDSAAAAAAAADDDDDDDDDDDETELQNRIHQWVGLGQGVAGWLPTTTGPQEAMSGRREQEG